EGKYVLIDFFYTDCSPCIGAIPALREIYETYGCNTQELVQLSINYGEPENVLFNYYYDYDPAQPLVSGTEGNGNMVRELYSIPAYPTVILIAPDRSIINQDIFPVSPENLDFALNYQAGIEPPTDGCLTVLNTTSTSSLLDQIKISPNPSSGPFHLTGESTHRQQVEIVVYDLLAQPVDQRIMELMIGSFDQTLDLTGLPSGAYLLSWQVDGQQPEYRQIQIHR
ncbi:MAG: T9SS type A sorting domain-containing protein, partial [Bacteroidota bacterium]